MAIFMLTQISRYFVALSLGTRAIRSVAQYFITVKTWLNFSQILWTKLKKCRYLFETSFIFRLDLFTPAIYLQNSSPKREVSCREAMRACKSGIPIHEAYVIMRKKPRMKQFVRAPHFCRYRKSVQCQLLSPCQVLCWRTYGW